ncbi:Hypothetical predicted protein [Pelobates cultripes]|uniref:TTF-type domain-containing protein n=1 Tax=Pelobates cultripes TaxID=61616 RepID=A0AAD1T5Z2_PELCU|nr:Hypothetical predicted protein [Pelobates cultripes]
MDRTTFCVWIVPQSIWYHSRLSGSIYNDGSYTVPQSVSGSYHSRLSGSIYNDGYHSLDRSLCLDRTTVCVWIVPQSVSGSIVPQSVSGSYHSLCLDQYTIIGVVPMKKQRSGWEKLKARKEEEKQMQKILSKTKKITDFCGKSTSGTSSVTDIHASASSSTSTIAVSASSATSGSTELDYENITEQQEEIYSNDIGDWNICDALREYFCENGVTNCQHMDSDFSASEKICPGETFTKHCTKSLFFREQLNGEKVKRDWLCYSPKTCKVFCALCKLFSKDETTHLTSTGYLDWRHATRDLSRHENSASHGKAIEALIRRKTSGQRIDKDLVNQFENQKKYCHKMLCRILSVIKLLSS